MKTMTAALLLAALAATSSAKSPDAQKPDPQAEKELATALAGKVPGKPIDCVSTFRGNSLHAVGEHTILFRVSKKLVYRNEVLGSCGGFAGDALVVHIQSDQYCRGDIANMVDLTTGTWHGSCTLGQFVPYSAGGAG